MATRHVGGQWGCAPPTVEGESRRATGDAASEGLLGVEPGEAGVEPGEAGVEPGEAGVEPGEAGVEPGEARAEPERPG